MSCSLFRHSGLDAFWWQKRPLLLLGVTFHIWNAHSKPPFLFFFFNLLLLLVSFKTYSYYIKTVNWCILTELNCATEPSNVGCCCYCIAGFFAFCSEHVRHPRNNKSHCQDIAVAPVSLKSLAPLHNHGTNPLCISTDTVSSLAPWCGWGVWKCHHAAVKCSWYLWITWETSRAEVSKHRLKFVVRAWVTVSWTLLLDWLKVWWQFATLLLLGEVYTSVWMCTPEVTSGLKWNAVIIFMRACSVWLVSPGPLLT